MNAEIVELSAEQAEAHLPGLTNLLLDAVAGGASVNFLAGLTRGEAERFWRGHIAAAASGRTLLFAAMADGQLFGCVLLHPAWQPNQPHRADVSKLLVHRSARRRGLATALISALERRAAELGRTLLTLDTEKGSGAEPFYRKHGYVAAGEIPGYALTPDGRPEAAVFFYKVVG